MTVDGSLKVCQNLINRVPLVVAAGLRSQKPRSYIFRLCGATM